MSSESEKVTLTARVDRETYECFEDYRKQFEYPPAKQEVLTRALSEYIGEGEKCE
jgi:hypothetical protein